MDNSSIPEPDAQEPRPSPSRSPYAVTIALIAINVLVFLAMGVSGVSLTDPTPDNVLAWGGDFGPATIGAHQYWRLLTSCFLHFGILHIGFNMYVLFQIGPFIETVFGRARYLVIYLCAGLFGSLVSVWIHPTSVGAGASGAIFGLYGALFGFLLIQRRTLNPVVTRSIAKSAGIFLLYNLVYGVMSRTTDLSAHFGGLIAGFLVGMLLVRPRSAAGASLTTNP
jgi:rhomboid protease GluP